jgi:hypothetical protein
MTHYNTLEVVVEPTHPMASSNTKSPYLFRLSNGNYISRMAYVAMVASEGLISHRYLTPSESQWVFANRVS